MSTLDDIRSHPRTGDWVECTRYDEQHRFAVVAVSCQVHVRQVWTVRGERHEAELAVGLCDWCDDLVRAGVVVTGCGRAGIDRAVAETDRAARG